MLRREEEERLRSQEKAARKTQASNPTAERYARTLNFTCHCRNAGSVMSHEYKKTEFQLAEIVPQLNKYEVVFVCVNYWVISNTNFVNRDKKLSFGFKKNSIY